MTRYLLPLAAIALQSCALSMPPEDTAGEAAFVQTGAALGQTVRVGAIAITPTALIEDSRCPVDAQCIWAGRVVLAVDVIGSSGRGARQVTLGEPFAFDRRSYALMSAAPDKRANVQTAPADYRFLFEAR